MPMCTRTGDKPFKCDCCEFSFQKRNNIMRIHTGAIQVSCSDTLNIHNMHTNIWEKPLKRLLVVEIDVVLVLNKKIFQIVHNAYCMYHQKVDVAIFVIVQQWGYVVKSSNLVYIMIFRGY